jgi:tetratricopeptide (TPR) repeat protein
MALVVTGCAGVLESGRELEKSGDLLSAVQVYKDALRSDPTNVEILASLGSDLMLLGKFDEAMIIQEKTIHLNPKDTQTRIELGFNYLNHQGRSADSVRVLREAVRIETSAKTLTFLAQALIQNGELLEAESSLREAIRIDPTYAHPYQVLHNLLLRLGKTAEAAQVEKDATVQGIGLN